MAYEDQRAAREADVAGGDRRTSKRAEGSADPRHEPVDGFLRSKGIRFLEAAKSALVRADELGVGARAVFERPLDLDLVRAGGEIELSIQRVQPKDVPVRPVAWRRARAAPA